MGVNLNASLSTYAEKYKAELLRNMYLGLEFATIPGVEFRTQIKDNEKMAKLTVSGKPKPRTGEHVAREDDLNYTDRTLQVEAYQRDFTIDPKAYQKTWLNRFQPAGSGVTMKAIPFEQFTYETVLLDLQSEINNETAWIGQGKAAFSAVAGAGGSAGDLVFHTQDGEVRYFIVNAGGYGAAETPTTDPAKFTEVSARAINKGWLTIIAEEITATALTEVATGAIDNSTVGSEAVTVMKELWRSFGPAYKKQKGYIYSSITNFEALMDDLVQRLQYTRGDVMSSAGTIILPETMGLCEVVPVGGMGESNRLIAAMPNALVAGTDIIADHSDIRVKEDVYHLDMGVEGVIGFQISDLEAIKVNDQA